MSMLQQGTSLLFVGNSGNFRSDILLFNIHIGVAEAMAMPHFHEGQKLWEMKSQEMILWEYVSNEELCIVIIEN